MAGGVDVSENINTFNVSLTTLIAKNCQDYSSNVFVTTDTFQKYPYVGIEMLWNWSNCMQIARNFETAKAYMHQDMVGLKKYCTFSVIDLDMFIF